MFLFTLFLDDCAFEAVLVAVSPQVNHCERKSTPVLAIISLSSLDSASDIA
jgi:hypothetical protein